MKLPIYSFLLISLSLLLSSCRYTHWAEEIFNQGCPQNTTISCAQQYVRSLRMYDQLTTLGIFDALWLSDEVCQYYADLYAQTHCLNQDQHDCVEDTCNQNDNFVSFYVLGWVKGDVGISLTDKDSLWSVCLCLDGNCYQPVSIKIVDLLPEYKAFFGKTFTRFKTAYLVKFDAHEAIIDDTRKIELVFKRIGYQGSMVWCFDAEGNVIPERDFDKNILAYDM